MGVRPARRRWMAVVVGALLAAGSAPALAAPPTQPPTRPQTPASDRPTAGARELGDPVFPEVGNGGYDVQSYRLDLAYDAASGLVDGSVAVTARATQHLSELSLDSVGPKIESVSLLGNVAQDEPGLDDPAGAAYAVDGAKLIVEPDQAIPKRVLFTIVIDFVVDPSAAAAESGWVRTDDGVALAPQPVGARTVFPCNDHPSDKATYVFSVTAPPGKTGVASGLRVGERVAPDGSTTTTYVSAHPIATELVQVAVGDYTIVDRGWVDGVSLRDVVPTDRVADLEPALALTPDHLAWSREHLGDFPLEAYGLLPVDTDNPDAFGFTGLETQTLTLYKPTYLEQAEDKIASHMMHEIVHSWFGNSVTPADWSALWINEGHADLYGLMYRYERGWPDAFGYTTLEDRMRYTYTQGDSWRTTSGPVAVPGADTLFDNQRYTGATLVLYALREFVGPKTFKRIEDRFLRTYRDRSASTDDFISVAAEVSGRSDVEPFLTDWLYGTVTPPMPNHPGWTVDPVPASAKTAVHGPRTDRFGP